jgi:hypothetical protein
VRWLVPRGACEEGMLLSPLWKWPPLHADATGVVHEVVAVETAGGVGPRADVAAVEWVTSGIVDDVAVAVAEVAVVVV